MNTPSLDALYFYLTSYCNLNCIHCWLSPAYIDKDKAPVEARFETLKDIIDQALPMGLRSIKITGGEPFLSKNISKLISYAAKKRLGISIETNATLINDAKAKFLKENKVSFVSVSLDGPDKKIHETLRGRKNCFDKALAGIKSLKKYGINVQAIMSIYKNNIDYAEDTINIAERYGSDSFKINPIWAISRGESIKRSGLVLSVEESIRLNQRIDKEIQPAHRIKILLDIPPAFKDIKHIRGNASRCRIKNILGVLPDAGISICGIGEVAPSLRLGNIKKQGLKEIWETNPVLKIIREDVPAKLKGICSRCIFKGFCLGKCRAEAYHRDKDLMSPYYFCEEAYESGLFPETRRIE